MKRKHKRLTFVMIALLLLGVATALVLTALEDDIVFFHAPSDIKAKNIGEDKRFRLGGLVEKGSVDKSRQPTVSFRVTDGAESIEVRFTGHLPDLFREEQGIVAEGKLSGGVFIADEVLAKHDENYMPPEVADALKRSGQWQGGEPGKGQEAPAK